MRIHVFRDFAGKLTGERRIYPGDYALDDAALFGVGQYLLDNGFAVSLGEPVSAEDAASEPEAEIDVVDADDEPVDYSTWTVSALKDELEERGIDIMALKGSGANGNVLKEDLVLVLQGDDADNAEEE